MKKYIPKVGKMTIEELLIDFDEMGFVPTTLCENPDEYAQDWKKQLVAEIKQLKAENRQLKTECALLDDELRIARQNTIDVLNELKEKYGFYSCYSWHCDTKLLSEIIDELLKEHE